MNNGGRWPRRIARWTGFTTVTVLVLGFGICALALVDLFILPKEPDAYRTWLNFGVVLVPMLLVFAIAIW